MVATWNFYDSATRDLMDGRIDLDTDTIKVLIASSSYTPSQTAHTKRSDVTNEVTGTGYTTLGKTLTTPALTLDTTNHRTKLTADNLTWTAVTFTAGRYAVIFKSRGGASSADELIAYIDFGEDITMTGGNFILTWNASGLFRLTRT